MNAAPANASLVDPELRIPLVEVGEMLDRAIAVTGDPAIGLHAAAFFEPKDRDPLEEETIVEKRDLAISTRAVSSPSMSSLLLA